MTAVKMKTKKRPSLAWKDKYKAPNSKDNPTRLWVLPSLAAITDDLRACHGQLDVLVGSLSKNSKRQELLLMQIFELRSKEPFGGIGSRDEWLDVIASGEDARQALSEYSR